MPFEKADRMKSISGSVIRELLKLTAKPGMISFAGGNPSSQTLPDEELAEIAKKLLLEKGKVLLQYGATEGYKPFIETLTSYIQDEFAAQFKEDEILPVTGSTQAMDLLCKAYLNEGDTVICESPTFLGNVQCLRIFGANIVEAKSDDDGLIPELLEEQFKQLKPKMLYTIPTFQNPTGITLTVERRKAIAALAEKYNVLVAEDDPYHSLRYEGQNVPSIKSFDQAGKVVLMGSFSKVISPGLRVGFVAGEKSLVRTMTVCKQSTDVQTPSLNQAMVNEYIVQGKLEPHIKQLCIDYKEQLNEMLSGLAAIKGIKHYTRPEGGLFVFASLDESRDVSDLFKQAVERGVAFVPGEPFYPYGGHKNTLRLNFSNATIPNIKRGMQILKECIDG
jgi:2-aminoadipate transaminase